MTEGRAALRVGEVSEALGVSEETVRRALVRGELPGRKLGIDLARPDRRTGQLATIDT